MLLGDFDGTLRQSAHYPQFETIGILQIRVTMITGDHRITAAAIAKMLGIGDGKTNAITIGQNFYLPARLVPVT